MMRRDHGRAIQPPSGIRTASEEVGKKALRSAPILTQSSESVLHRLARSWMQEGCGAFALCDWRSSSHSVGVSPSRCPFGHAIGGESAGSPEVNDNRQSRLYGSDFPR